MNRRILTAFLTLVAFAGMVGTASAESPAEECQAAFGAGYAGYKVEENESQLNGTYADPSTGFSVTISNTNTNVHTFDYSASWPVNVIVKGGSSPGNFYSPRQAPGCTRRSTRTTASSAASATSPSAGIRTLPTSIW
jgi:opacity protein-like surface antigen